MLDVTYAQAGRPPGARDAAPRQCSPGPSPRRCSSSWASIRRATTPSSSWTRSCKGAGEGNCKPSETDCAFLSIGAGSEHEFKTAEDGNTYGLRIDQIRRVKLQAASAKGSAKRKPAKNEEGDGASGSSQETRRFTPPVLLDLMDSVASSDGG